MSNQQGWKGEWDVREWGPMALCALMLIVAFYIWILYGTPWRVAVYLVIGLICPLVYLYLLLGDGGGGGGKRLPDWRAALVARLNRLRARRALDPRTGRPKASP